MRRYRKERPIIKIRNLRIGDPYLMYMGSTRISNPVYLIDVTNIGKETTKIVEYGIENGKLKKKINYELKMNDTYSPQFAIEDIERIKPNKFRVYVIDIRGKKHRSGYLQLQ